jgi:hypothetical protein
MSSTACGVILHIRASPLSTSSPSLIGPERNSPTRGTLDLDPWHRNQPQIAQNRPLPVMTGI